MLLLGFNRTSFILCTIAKGSYGYPKELMLLRFAISVLKQRMRKESVIQLVGLSSSIPSISFFSICSPDRKSSLTHCPSLAGSLDDVDTSAWEVVLCQNFQQSGMAWKAERSAKCAFFDAAHQSRSAPRERNEVPLWC